MPRDGSYLPQETQTDRDLAVLRAAREEIARPGGWCKGEYHNIWGGHCAVGAIEVALGMRSLKAAKEIATRLLVPALPYSSTTVAGFNDWSFRLKEDVLALYDRAIARVEKQRDGP